MNLMSSFGHFRDISIQNACYKFIGPLVLILHPLFYIPVEMSSIGSSSIFPALVLLNLTFPSETNFIWVVGDGKHLPFKDGAFHLVLQ